MTVQPFDVGQSQVVKTISEEFDYIDGFEKRYGKSSAKERVQSELEERQQRLITRQREIRERAEDERSKEMQRMDEELARRLIAEETKREEAAKKLKVERD